MNVDNLPQLTQFQIDEHAHIILNKEICKACDHRACVQSCPASCYTFDEATKLMSVVYETCLECGTCMIACVYGSVTWVYPRGEYGVQYRYG